MRNLFYTLGALFLLTFFLIQAQFILKPLVLGGMIAVAINPMINWLIGRLKYHWLAFLVLIVLFLVILSGTSYVISDQLIALFEDLNTEKFDTNSIKASFSKFLGNLGLSYGRIDDFLSQGISTVAENTGSFISGTLSAGGAFMITSVLSLLFTYLFSAYYPDLKKYALQIFEKEDRRKIRSIVNEIPRVIRDYIQGVSIVMLIMGIVMSIFYLILGLDYALVWGLLTGLLVFIPYVGSFIALLLPLTYSLITSDTMTQPLIIMGFYIVAQQIEGNILTPKIVGNKVNLNPISTIILLLISAQIWGVLGVFISIPLGGMMKIALESWDDTEAYAVLISEEITDRDTD